MENIRNLWLTEKTGEPIFGGVRQVEKWAHLKQSYSFESERLVKLSDLNEISIAPKPILKAPFLIATTPRGKGGCYSFPCIAPLYP